MKWLFILLVIANLLFYGYTKLAEPPAPIDWKAREVKADALKTVGSEPKPVVAQSEADATEAAAAPVAPPEKPADSTGKQALSCFVWRGILPEDMPNARKKLAALKLGGEVKVETSEPDTPKRYWVFIPPRPSAEDAQKKAEQLKAIGVEDFFVVSDGSRWNHAISLGLFSSQEAAERRLEGVRQKGVRTAISRERNEASATRNLVLRHIGKQARMPLSEAATGFKGSTVVETGC
ncbi:SPOR domain-containing protein [Chitinimonas arctica]|uniref:SPOR domain-containing protein n=1 Tax=Chitinimonas arctica TaxID=2594795 RepID=A0A516SEI1_9NEIS|nr:SPOR domain-containing protein [Chitinimonas arctica]QDQ26561.1 SPOR domain-containing protein [Chitinimonas arctica]